MNILISSLGITPQIVEEALGLFNGMRHDFYSQHPNEEYVKRLRTELGLSKCLLRCVRRLLNLHVQK